MVYTLKGHVKKYLPNLLIILGALIILSTLVATQYHKVVASVSGKQVLLVKSSISQISPTSVQIAGLTGNIPVKSGQFDGKSWTEAKDSALYLDSSGIPGKKGNVVIYGHNTKEVFSPLSEAKIGQDIKLMTSDNQTLIYKIEEIANVTPANVEILTQTDSEEKLTLFTCTSLFDSMRLVVKAVRV